MFKYKILSTLNLFIYFVLAEISDLTSIVELVNHDVVKINSSDFAMTVFHPNSTTHEQIIIIQNKKVFQRVGMRSNGCSCKELMCGCCFGMNINQINFNREGCMNFTYHPYDFAIGVKMMWNNQKIYDNKISGKNPPPLCVPIPNPIPILPTLEFCAKLFDIYTPGRNLHMCFDLETRIQRAPVLVLHFNCMRLGADGVAMVKPEDMGGLGGSGGSGSGGSGGAPGGSQEEPPNIGPSSTTEVAQIDADVYDEITEVKKQNKLIDRRLL